MRMKSVPVLLIACCLAATMTAKTVKTPPPLEGADALVYKEVSESKLILNVFYPEGHNPNKDKRPFWALI